MARMTAAEYLAKWSRNTQQAVADYRTGIQRVTVAPGIAAARAQDKMLQGITEAVTSGRWASAVAGVSLQDWQRASIEVGAGRIPAGVTAAAANGSEMAQRLLALVDAAQNSISTMPSLTFQDRVQRMVAFVTYMNDHPLT